MCPALSYPSSLIYVWLVLVYEKIMKEVEKVSSTVANIFAHEVQIITQCHFKVHPIRSDSDCF